MTTALEAPRARVLDHLARTDAESREARAGRTEWLLHHDRRPGILIGRSETMQILAEATGTFVDGHFVATLLLAMSFFEHVLAEELQLLDVPTKSLAENIAAARELKVFPSDWLAKADALRLKRNPYAHLSRHGHEHSMGVRFRRRKVHPKIMLEEDAKAALELMFDVLVATAPNRSIERLRAMARSDAR